MLQLLPQSKELCPNTLNPSEAIEFINEYIDNYHCENLSVDISCMNIIDSCSVATLCSTQHFIKYPTGKVTWKVSSDLVEELNKSLELGNVDYCYL